MLLKLFGQNKIEQKLDFIIKELNQMAVDQPQFDAALATLVTNYGNMETTLNSVVTAVAAIGTALNQFIIDYNNKTGVDLTNELASVTALTNSVATDSANASADLTALNSDLANIQAADPNTVPPAPPASASK